MLVEPRSSGADIPRRHTVRIVKRRRPQRAAVISLLVTACAAGVGFLAFRVWQTDEPLEPYQRGLSDVLLTYRCERGETFQNNGQIAPRTCSNCGLPAYPVATYLCEEHAQEQEFLVQFAVDSYGDAYVAKVKPAPPHESQRISRPAAPAEWVDAESAPVCPKCGILMIRKPIDTIDFSKLHRREGQGTPRKPVQTSPDRPGGSIESGS